MAQPRLAIQAGNGCGRMLGQRGRHFGISAWLAAAWANPGDGCGRGRDLLARDGGGQRQAAALGQIDGDMGYRRVNLGPVAGFDQEEAAAPERIVQPRAMQRMDIHTQFRLPPFDAEIAIRVGTVGHDASRNAKPVKASLSHKIDFGPPRHSKALT